MANKKWDKDRQRTCECGLAWREHENKRERNNSMLMTVVLTKLHKAEVLIESGEWNTFLINVYVHTKSLWMRDVSYQHFNNKIRISVNLCCKVINKGNEWMNFIFFL